MKKQFYNCDDIKRILEVKESKAYEIIRKLNAELEEKGKMVQRGRVNVAYFEKRYNIG